MMDIPHPNSYPVPRGRPGLHDIYVGKRKTKNKKADPPLIDAKRRERESRNTKRKRWLREQTKVTKNTRMPSKDYLEI